MRLGQPATIEIDAFPDLDLKGHLSSFSPGTGNSFAVLPAENATGNWVKVVQRLAVEITIDSPPAYVPLHAGLRSEEHTSELQSLMRNSYAVFCLKNKKK